MMLFSTVLVGLSVNKQCNILPATHSLNCDEGSQDGIAKNLEAVRDEVGARVDLLVADSQNLAGDR